MSTSISHVSNSLSISIFHFPGSSQHISFASTQEMVFVNPLNNIDEYLQSFTLITVGVKITVLWNVMPCNLVATTRTNAVKFQ